TELYPYDQAGEDEPPPPAKAWRLYGAPWRLASAKRTFSVISQSFRHRPGPTPGSAPLPRLFAAPGNRKEYKKAPAVSRRGLVHNSGLSRPAAYSTIEATMPAPTVRPPSRMAKRSFSSIAIGTISS